MCNVTLGHFLLQGSSLKIDSWGNGLQSFKTDKYYQINNLITYFYVHSTDRTPTCF